MDVASYLVTYCYYIASYYSYILHLLAAIHRAQKVRTYIDQVVGGEMLSVVICDNCKHVSSM